MANQAAEALMIVGTPEGEDLARSLVDPEGLALARGLAETGEGLTLARGLVETAEGLALVFSFAGREEGRALAGRLVETEEGLALTLRLVETGEGRALTLRMAETAERLPLTLRLAETGEGLTLARRLVETEEGLTLARWLAGELEGQILARRLVETGEGLTLARRLVETKEGRALTLRLAETMGGHQLALTLRMTRDGRALAAQLAETGEGEEDSLGAASIFSATCSLFAWMAAAVVFAAAVQERDDDEPDLVPVPELAGGDALDYRNAVEPVLSQAHLLLQSGEIENEVKAEQLRVNADWLRAHVMIGDLDTGLPTQAAAPIFFAVAATVATYTSTETGNPQIERRSAELVEATTSRPVDDPDFPEAIADKVEEITEGRVTRKEVLTGFGAGSAVVAVGSLLADVGLQAATAVFSSGLLAAVLTVAFLTWRKARTTPVPENP